LASGNAPAVARGGVATIPVDGLPPSQLALAWRKVEPHPLVHPYVECARQALTSS
jgi:hypothetical protein